jgi:hypothetical protein
LIPPFESQRHASLRDAPEHDEHNHRSNRPCAHLRDQLGDRCRRHAGQQLLHLVFGGELKSLDGVEFADIAALDIVGIYPNYVEAYKAWKAVAQRTVDNAQIRYFIVHIHRLLDPELTGPPAGS